MGIISVDASVDGTRKSQVCPFIIKKKKKKVTMKG